MDGRHSVELAATPGAALAAVAHAAEDWGGLWQPTIDGGRLELPVLAGLRRGRLRGRVSVEPAAGGSRVTFEVEDDAWSLHRPALAIAAIGGAGGLFGLVSPFLFAAYPERLRELSSLVALGSLLAFTAWFLVVSRLRTSGPREFLESLTEPSAD